MPVSACSICAAWPATPSWSRQARSSLLTSWRHGARKRLPELVESIADRRTTFGDAAYLLEPDLKEARGGFRDMSMLRALAATWLTDLPHTGVRQPYDKLLDVRDALHLVSGRALDRLLATEIADVAEQLGYPDADALHRHVSLAARRIGYALDLDRPRGAAGGAGPAGDQLRASEAPSPPSPRPRTA